MAKPYRKPSKYGGHRIIPRTSGGRFTRHVMETRVCPECRGFILPETINVGTRAFPMLKEVWPKKCAHCGKKLLKENAMAKTPQQIADHMVAIHHGVKNALEWAMLHESENLGEGNKSAASHWRLVRLELEARMSSRKNPMTKKQQDAFNRREAPYAFAQGIKLHHQRNAVVERASMRGGAVYMRPGGRSKNFLKLTYAGVGRLGAPLIKIEAINIPRGTLKLLGYPKSITSDDYNQAARYVDTIFAFSTAVRNPCSGRKRNQVVSSINEAIRIARAEAPSPYAKAYADAAMEAASGYGMEGLRVQVLYLLNNLSTWRGPRAREVKAFMRSWAKKPSGSKRRNPAALAKQLLDKLVEPDETFTRTSLAAGMRARGMKDPGKYVDEFIRDAKLQGLIYNWSKGVYRRAGRAAANPKRRPHRK